MKAISIQKYENKIKAREQATEYIMEKWKDFCSKMDITLIHCLHFYFDFDHDKLVDFYRKWIESYILLQKQWQSGGDETHYWKMEHDLKLDGITYDEFDKILTEIGDKYGV